jgi:hypothetical protein
MAAAVGEAMIGLGTWFEHAVVSWSALRLFIDMTRVRNYENP